MSNSRVESHSRAELRNKIISAATLLEILLSGLVLIGLLLSMVPLLQWMPGLLFDGNDVEVSIFLQRALDIVIGIEFIKMLAKHSPGSSLEVLLYAIARHMVVGPSALICPTATPHPTFPPARAASRRRNSPPGCASTCIMTTPTRSLKSPSKTPSTRTTPTRCWKQTRNEPDNVKYPAGSSQRASCGAFFMLSCSCASGRNGTPCRPGCAGCWNGASR